MASVKSVKLIAWTVTKKEFQKFLTRDGHCYHCGTTDDTLVPQHRRNRGMGGSQSRSKPSNVVVLCSYINGIIEASEDHSKAAQRYGWKLRQGQDPLETPAYDSLTDTWWLFDDSYQKREMPLGQDSEPRG